jgi:hypothetical protein
MSRVVSRLSYSFAAASQRGLRMYTDQGGLLSASKYPIYFAAVDLPDPGGPLSRQNCSIRSLDITRSTARERVTMSSARSCHAGQGCTGETGHGVDSLSNGESFQRMDRSDQKPNCSRILAKVGNALSEFRFGRIVTWSRGSVLLCSSHNRCCAAACDWISALRRAPQLVKRSSTL